MSNVLNFIKKELLELLPPTIFFFVVFEIVVGARFLMGSSIDYSVVTTASAAIAALIIGKSILIIDALPLFRWFSDKPLILNTLWRFLLYMLLVLLFQVLEELIPLASKYQGLAGSFTHLMEEVHWPRFLATHAILVIFLGIYCVISGLVGMIGADKARQAFFGKAAPTN